MAQPTPAGPKSERPAGRPAQPAPTWLDRNQADAGGAKYHTFESKAAGTAVSYHIYLPPDYETAKDRRYPVVYWLHGRGGSETGVSVFASRLDAAIKAGKAPAMIAVGVNGMRTSSWVDSFDGKTPVQSMLIKDLIPHIDATYRTIPTRESRAIEGFSMGGAGAPKVGFKFPELFGVVGVISGALHTLESYSSRGTAFEDVFGSNKEYFEANDPWNVLEKNAAAIRDRTFVRVAVGAKDNLLEKNTAYHDLLTKLKIEHSFDVIPDAVHNPAQVYDGLGDKTWAFYTKAFAAPVKPTAATAAPAARPRPAPRAASELPAPTHANVAYGTHERQVLDFWQAKSARPSPLAVFIHGGGFVGGSKEQVNARDLQQLLEAGISVTAVNYRLLSHAPLPAAHQDATRAVQFLRSKAAEWQLDPKRLGGFGGSAGAQLVMYLAFHDDLAAPAAADPVARESSRLACVAPTSGQLTMDMDWWDQHVPGYAAQATRRRTNAELFGTSDAAAAMKINADISAITLIGPGDPPVFMTYGMAPGAAAPTDRRESQNWMIHHIVHGIELKRLGDAAGVEAFLNYPGANTPYSSATKFLIAKLQAP